MVCTETCNAVSVENGAVINTIDGRPIERPAVCIDKATGTLHSWGNKSWVYAAYTRMTEQLHAQGALKLAEDLVYIEFDPEVFTPERCAYIIERCVRFTASGFQTMLCSKVQHCPGADILAWIDAEMKRVPIEL